MLISATARAVVFVLLAATLSVSAADSPAPVSFTVQEATVTAAGLTPGGAAVVLNVSIESSGNSSITTRTWRDARTGADGKISVSFAHAIAADAFVAVIDVESGRLAKSSDTQTSFQRESFPARRLKRNANAEVEQVFSPNASAMVVVVRPGAGAWLRVAHDGGAGDADGVVDGRITTDPSSLRAIAGSGEPPKKITPRDVVLVADPQCLCYALTEVVP